jgi:hypothetical protein
MTYDFELEISSNKNKILNADLSFDNTINSSSLFNQEGKEEKNVKEGNSEIKTEGKGIAFRAIACMKEKEAVVAHLQKFVLVFYLFEFFFFTFI